jgi:hypothetical protein
LGLCAERRLRIGFDYLIDIISDGKNLVETRINLWKTMSANSNTNNDDEEIDRVIAEYAYYIAEQRGFEPGFEVQDWITSEKDIATITDSFLWLY